MQRFFLFIGLLLFGLVGKAQQNYFIYLQTDNRQPFYVKIDKELYSSSASGYAIIPKLQKGPLVLNIGFPKKEWPEQKITINVIDDAGYSLKNFNDKGWGLFNLQSLAVSMANNDSNMETTINEVNDFAGTLATVVNTPSLNEKRVPVKKADEVPAVKQTTEEVAEVEAIKIEQQPEPEIIKTEVVNKEEIKKATVEQVGINTIQRISKAADAQGIALVYIDNNGGLKDTVQIFIADAAPERKTEIVNTIPQMPTKSAEELKVEKKEVSEAVHSSNEDKRFLNMELPNPNAKEAASNVPDKKETEVIAIKKEKVDEEKIIVPSNQKEEPVVVINETNNKLTFNSDCKAIASADDFFKTRKRMAAENNADDMIREAKKRFKSACYSTEQIKNLSVLFLKDETRYNFFDAAYPFVHDTQNFADLVTSLNDEYYISRFKAMLR